MGFTLDGGLSLKSAPGNQDTPQPRVDNQCNKDFIIIAGSSEACNTIARRDRYCGDMLNVFKNSMPNIPICDCTPPFLVEIVTDGLTGGDGAGVGSTEANEAQSRGNCLEYMQIPCGTATP